MKDYKIGDPIVFEDEFGNVKDGTIACENVYGSAGQYGIDDGDPPGLYSRNADEIVPADGEEQYAIPVLDDDEYYVYPIM